MKTPRFENHETWGTRAILHLPFTRKVGNHLLSVWKELSTMGQPVVHWELMSKDPAKIAGFYEKIFGWKIKHMPEMNYRVVETESQESMAAS